MVHTVSFRAFSSLAAVLRHRRRETLLLWASWSLFAGTFHGQELEPRTYAQTPIGVNFIAVGYGFSTGNVLMDPALPIEGLDADLDLIFLRYTRSFAFLGRSAKVKILAPWSGGDYDTISIGYQYAWGGRG